MEIIKGIKRIKKRFILWLSLHWHIVASQFLNRAHFRYDAQIHIAARAQIVEDTGRDRVTDQQFGLLQLKRGSAGERRK